MWAVVSSEVLRDATSCTRIPSGTIRRLLERCRHSHCINPWISRSTRKAGLYHRAAGRGGEPRPAPTGSVEIHWDHPDIRFRCIRRLASAPAMRPPYGQAGDAGSAQADNKYSAACLCGRVRLGMQVDPPTSYRCHCQLCTRLGSGARWACALPNTTAS